MRSHDNRLVSTCFDICQQIGAVLNTSDTHLPEQMLSLIETSTSRSETTLTLTGGWVVGWALLTQFRSYHALKVLQNIRLQYRLIKNNEIKFYKLHADSNTCRASTTINLPINCAICQWINKDWQSDYQCTITINNLSFINTHTQTHTQQPPDIWQQLNKTVSVELIRNLHTHL